MKTPIILLLIISFLTSNIPFVRANDIALPAPGVMVHLSPDFSPAILKGIKVHPDQPFKFEFILDTGDTGTVTDFDKLGTSPDFALRGFPQKSGDVPNLSQEHLKQQANTLIKYFLASLTTPEKDLWVNLSPYEKDRIVPDSFGQTEMGRDLLAQDYMLKQITASLIYPEDEIGRKFWKRIYEEAAKKYGNTNIPVNTFNKVWIVPEKAVVYESSKNGTAYIVESHLKVLLEADYLALQKGEASKSIPSPKDERSTKERSLAGARDDAQQIGTEVVRQIVIPELTKEVNQGKNFAKLRQVYNSLILATWYKKKIKDSILNQVYADKSKIEGLKPTRGHAYNKTNRNVSRANTIANMMPARRRSGGPSTLPSKKSIEGESNPEETTDVEAIYQQYLQAFKKGVYNYIKEEPGVIASPTGKAIFSDKLVPRKYFSGGLSLAMSVQLEMNHNSAQITETSQGKFVVGAMVQAAMAASLAKDHYYATVQIESGNKYFFEYDGAGLGPVPFGNWYDYNIFDQKGNKVGSVSFIYEQGTANKNPVLEILDFSEDSKLAMSRILYEFFKMFMSNKPGSERVEVVTRSPAIYENLTGKVEHPYEPGRIFNLGSFAMTTRNTRPLNLDGIDKFYKKRIRPEFQEEFMNLLRQGNLKAAQELYLSEKSYFEPYQLKPRKALYPGGFDFHLLDLFPNLKEMHFVNLIPFREVKDIFVEFPEDYKEQNLARFLSITYSHGFSLTGSQHLLNSIGISVEKIFQTDLKNRGCTIKRTEAFEGGWKIAFEDIFGQERVIYYHQEDLYKIEPESILGQLIKRKEFDLLFSKGWEGGEYPTSIYQSLNEQGLYATDTFDTKSSIVQLTYAYRFVLMQHGLELSNHRFLAGKETPWGIVGKLGKLHIYDVKQIKLENNSAQITETSQNRVDLLPKYLPKGRNNVATLQQIQALQKQIRKEFRIMLQEGKLPLVKQFNWLNAIEVPWEDISHSGDLSKLKKGFQRNYWYNQMLVRRAFVLMIVKILQRKNYNWENMCDDLDIMHEILLGKLTGFRYKRPYWRSDGSSKISRFMMKKFFETFRSSLFSETKEGRWNLIGMKYTFDKSFLGDPWDYANDSFTLNTFNKGIGRLVAKSQAMTTPAKNRDSAQLSNKTGGINLTSEKMNVEVKTGSPTKTFGDDKDGGIKFHMDPAMLTQLQNAPGFTSVIVSFKPLDDLHQFLGINQ